MKIEHVKNAVGMVLAHDMTEIIPGVSKKAAFKKGQVIQENDIPRLLRMGKEHIYVLDFGKDDIHENDAAIRMAQAATGYGIRLTEPSEGKVSMIADVKGLLKIKREALLDINCINEIVMSTRHGNIVVEPGMNIGGTRIIPLMTTNQKIELVEEVCNCHEPVIEIMPLRPLKVGIVTTGGEVYHRRIEDKFGPILREKFKELDCTVIGQIIADDDADMILQAIEALIEEGAELIACTGGMSVDPDDVTPLAIRKTGAHIETYGAPTLPGAMFMLAYKGDIPIVGLPGCVMYARRTIFDLVLPRLVAGENVTKRDIVSLGYGGMCTNCENCIFPNCGFGKGGF